MIYETYHVSCIECLKVCKMTVFESQPSCVCLVQSGEVVTYPGSPATPRLLIKQQVCFVLLLQESSVSTALSKSHCENE